MLFGILSSFEKPNVKNNNSLTYIEYNHASHVKHIFELNQDGDIEISELSLFGKEKREIYSTKIDENSFSLIKQVDFGKLSAFTTINVF